MPEITDENKNGEVVGADMADDTGGQPANAADITEGDSMVPAQEEPRDGEPSHQVIFSPLGPILTALRREAEASPGVLRTWFNNGMGNDRGDFLLNELKSIERARALLSNTTSHFLEEPALVRRLRIAYETAKEYEVLYLRLALADQIKYLLKQIGDESRLCDLRRRKRNIERGIERIDGEIRDIRAAAQKQMSKSVAILQVEETGISQIVNLGGGGNGIDAGDIVKKANYKIEKLHAQRSKAIDDFAMVSRDVYLYEALNGLLQETRAKLTEAGGPISEAESGLSAMPVLGDITREARAEMDMRKTTKRQRVLTPGGSRAKTPEAGVGIESAPAPRDAVGESIQRLQNLIQVAQGTNNRIRILVPDDGVVARSKVRKWSQLLNTMGFDGEIVTAFYKELDETTDIYTCVIVARSMNTHTGLWDRRKFNNIVVIEKDQPGTLLSAFQNMREKDSK